MDGDVVKFYESMMVLLAAYNFTIAGNLVIDMMILQGNNLLGCN